MNCTVRVITTNRSLIVKQSRPWVEKYPQFSAPFDRALGEMEFYRLAATHDPVARSMPQLEHGDPAARVLVLDDLGEGSDYTGIYQGQLLPETDILRLADYLTELHGHFRPFEGHGLANREMRALNSRHIFFIPLQPDNGLDLETIAPELARGARELMADRSYVQRVHELADHYLADGDRLVHGDFFPGSFLRTPFGPRVIDPEFGFFGRSEFDPAVLLAHLFLGDQPAAAAGLFLSRYRPPAGHDESLMIRHIGVEIMRRLIGYAQLPLAADGARRRRLLEWSRSLVLEPRSRHLHQPPS